MNNIEVNVIEALLGRKLKSVKADRYSMSFIDEEDNEFTFYHLQSCCESVTIESIVGDLTDLENFPILMAQEIISGIHPPDVEFEYEPESYTWTFYKFATIKGYVDVRWYGTSNGYYGEGVNYGWDIMVKG